MQHEMHIPGTQPHNCSNCSSCTHGLWVSLPSSEAEPFNNVLPDFAPFAKKHLDEFPQDFVSIEHQLSSRSHCMHRGRIVTPEELGR